jgi:hypothetical protein
VSPVRYELGFHITDDGILQIIFCSYNNKHLNEFLYYNGDHVIA